MTAWDTAISARSPYFWLQFEGTGVPTNYGSVSTTLTLSGTAPTYSVASLNGTCYNFNSSANYTLSSWSSVLNGNSWTIEAVVKGNNVAPGTVRQIISFYTSATNYLNLGLDTTNKLRLEYNNGSTGNVNFVSTEGINSGSWHHVALVYNSSATTLKVYLNGRLIQTRTVNLNSMDLDNSSKSVAGSVTATTTRWGGMIDELAIIPGILTDAQVQADSETLGFKYKKALFDSATTLNGYFSLDAAGTSNQLNEGTGTTSMLAFGAGVTRSIAGKDGISSQYGWTVAASNTGYFSLNCGSANLTDRVFGFEFWIKSSDTVSSGDKYILYNTGTDYVHLYARATSGGNAKLVARAQYTNGTSTEVDTGVIINNNAWHHVVVTHDGSDTANQTLKVYLDGTEYTSGPLSRGLMSGMSGIMYFGSNTNSTLGATFDEAAFYAGLLSSTDAVAHYNASIASTNAGYTAQVMTVSNSVFVDPVVTAEGFVSVNPVADPMNVSALFVDPVVGVTVDYVFNASPLTADGSFPAPQLAYLHIRTQYREDRPTSITPNVKYVSITHNSPNANLYSTYYSSYPIIGKADTHRVYWQFDSSNLTSADIYKAEMRMVSDEGTSQTVDLQFYRVTGSWALETITHNTQPTSTLVQNDGVDYVFGTGGAAVYVDIKTLLTNLIDNADTGFMMELASTSTDTQLDLAGYEFEFRIWTYTEPTNDSLTDIPQTASGTFVMPAILAGTDAGYTAQAMTASALNTDVTITADRNISYAANIMQVDAQHPDAVAFTSSDVSETFGTGANASAEFVNPTLDLVFNLSVAGSPFEASSSLVEPLLSASNTQTVTPATGQAELLAGTSISTEVNFIPDPMYITNSVIIDPQLYIVAVEEILADPMNATAGFPDSIAISTGVNYIENPWIVDANMPGGGISIDEIDTGGPMPAQADIIDPTRSLGVGIIGTPMTANASFDNPSIYAELGVNNVAGVMNATSATMVNPVVGVWDGYAAEVMTATATMKDAQNIYYKWELAELNLYNEWTYIWNAGGWSGTISMLNPTSTTGPGSRPAQTVTRAATPSTETNNKFVYIRDPRTEYESFYLPTIGGGVTAYATAANIAASQYAADSAVDGAYSQVACKHISAEYIIKTLQGNQTISFGKAFDDQNDKIISLHIKLEGGYPVWEYIQTDVNTNTTETLKYTGTKRVDDGLWHHLILQSTDGSNYYRYDYGDQFNTQTSTSNNAARDVINEYTTLPFTTEALPAVEIYVDGEINKRFKYDLDLTSNWVPAPHFFGQEYQGWVLVNSGPGTYAKRVALTPTTVGRFTGDISGIAIRTTRDVSQKTTTGETKYHAAVSPLTIRKLYKHAVELYSIEGQASTASAVMVNPVITTNTKQILRLYFNANNATGQMSGANTNMHDVITYSVLNETENNPNYLYNADAAYLGNNANPDSAATEIVVDAWRGDDGYRRFINLQSDVVNYSEIDAIVFMDYPNDSDEMDNLMPGYDKGYVKTKMTEFLSSVRQAVDDGKGLFVSSPQMAFDLKIVNSFTNVSQEIEESTTLTDPFGDSSGETFYDNVRNNKYKIVSTEDDLTKIGSYIMTDVISHTGDVSDEYHIKYLNRPNGLVVNDKMIIPSLPITANQLIRDTAGYQNNKVAENDLPVFEESEINAGRVIAKLGDTEYVTTIILEPGDILNGSPIGGKIIVNCVEDALTMGLEEYNYGYRQVVSVNDVDEDSTTILWDYSTSRTYLDLKPLAAINQNVSQFGQTYPTEGGGGPIIQAPTNVSAGNIRLKYDKSQGAFISGIYYDATKEKYPVDRIPVYSMTYRGINWLMNASDRQGEFVGGPAMIAQATVVEPTIVGQIIDPLPVKNATNTVLPMTASSYMVTNFDVIYGNLDTIVLTLHHLDVINLYIEQEKL